MAQSNRKSKSPAKVQMSKSGLLMVKEVPTRLTFVEGKTSTPDMRRFYAQIGNGCQVMVMLMTSLLEPWMPQSIRDEAVEIWFINDQDQAAGGWLEKAGSLNAAMDMAQAMFERGELVEPQY